MPVGISPYARHVERWKDCTNCPLCDTRKRTVFARGSLPCKVLFVGEAPGTSEDAQGLPFWGPAGHTLDNIISLSGLKDSGIPYAYTNLISCIPKEQDGGKLGEPPEESILACAERLQEFIGIADPSLIVCVGTHATKWIPKLWDGLPCVSIIHPAAIMRANPAQRGLEMQRAAIVISDAISDL